VGQAVSPAAAERSSSASQSPIVAPLKWKSSDVLIEPVSDDTHDIVSVKDPTVVYHNDMWHIYATTANTRGNWSMVYLSFKDWSEAAKAKPYYIDQNPGLRGYHCAPQVFYFRPHKKWYLIYQSQHPDRDCRLTTGLSVTARMPTCSLPVTMDGFIAAARRSETSRTG
jgi:hypothetical protein